MTAELLVLIAFMLATRDQDQRRGKSARLAERLHWLNLMDRDEERMKRA